MLSGAAPHPAIAVVDKVFGSDYSQLRAVIDGLLNHPTHPSTCVSVVVYVECGPCRAPRRPSGQFPVLLPKLSISALNQSLERAQVSTLKAFDKAIRRIETQLPELPGVRYFIEPGLEDNFTEQASKSVLSLLEAAFHGRDDITFARNRIDNRPVIRPLNFEVHRPLKLSALKGLRRGDIITADGYAVCLPGERNCSSSQSETKALLKAASRKGVIVLLWRPEWQGLTSQSSSVFVPPSRRKYTIAGRDFFRKLLDRR